MDRPLPGAASGVRPRRLLYHDATDKVGHISISKQRLRCMVSQPKCNPVLSQLLSFSFNHKPEACASAALEEAHASGLRLNSCYSCFGANLTIPMSVVFPSSIGKATRPRFHLVRLPFRSMSAT